MRHSADPGDVLICGIGQTAYTGNRGRSMLSMALESIVNACEDANISPLQIDGILNYPNSVSAEDIVSAFGIPRLRYTSTLHLGGASAVASLKHAELALRADVAQYIVMVRVRTNSTGPRVNQAPSQAPGQTFRRQLEEPYGMNTPAQRYALLCRRYMHEHGLTRQQLGAVAVAARRNANLNPAAQMYGKPLTLEDYMSARVIADPYWLFDCCLETDGACAIILSTRRSDQSGHPPAKVIGVAEGHPESADDLTNREEFLTIGLESAAAALWAETSLGPPDMDAAMIYDCFTFELIHQLEAAGFAPKGGGGEFVESVGIAYDGGFPVNTHGGLLSEGHLLGLNHVIEAVRQLRGDAGDRQLAAVDHVAVVGWGDLGDGAIAVLAGDR